MKLLLTFLFLFSCTLTRAQQNYVINPSFEQYSNCPDRGDEIAYTNNWMSLDSGWKAPDWAHENGNGVPEFCHVCAPVISGVGIPFGTRYYQYPRSGSGMAQVQMFENTSDTSDYYKRDYLQGRLRKQLIADKMYCVSFFVSLGDASFNAVNHIGAYFDDGTIDTTHTCGLVQSQYTPQVLETAIIADTAYWVKIEGSFTAGENQNIITIGQFTDSAHTNFIFMTDTTGLLGNYGAGYTWYVVDDISVIEGDAKPNAGADKLIPKGSVDSVIIGDTADTYLPTKWYENGKIIDSNKASIKVHPLVNSEYIVALDLCGTITYDTVMVFAGNVGLSDINYTAQKFKIFPNPNNGTFSVLADMPSDRPIIIEVVDAIGRVVYKEERSLTSLEMWLRLQSLSNGIYLLKVTDNLNNKFNLKFAIN